MPDGCGRVDVDGDGDGDSDGDGDGDSDGDGDGDGDGDDPRPPAEPCQSALAPLEWAPWVALSRTLSLWRSRR
jgi:hypothetical protein